MAEILMARQSDTMNNLSDDTSPTLGGVLEGGAFQVGNIGKLASGLVSPLGQGHFDQFSTTGAVPVLYLDQADISEEFIRFDAVAASGVTNPVSSDTTESDGPVGYVRININGTDRWLRFYADTD